MAPSAIHMMTVAAAATGAARASALALQQTQPRFVYRLGNSIYVPLTSRCNSLTLPQLRGDGFCLPTSVVAALLRVRDAEFHSHDDADSPSNNWYRQTGNGGGGDADLPLKMKLPPPPFEEVASLAPLTLGSKSKSLERAPRLDDLFQEIRDELEFRETNPNLSEAPRAAATTTSSSSSKQRRVESIVISGEGEPTLRLEDTMELVRRIRSLTNSLSTTTSEQAPPAIRLTTNGLVVPPEDSKPSGTSLPQTLCDSGVSHISVGIITWNAHQYHDLVRPVLGSDIATNGFETMCNFVKDAVSVRGDLEVEATAVDRPDVDKAKTEALARSLGVTKPVRWRPYFPGVK